MASIENMFGKRSHSDSNSTGMHNSPSPRIGDNVGNGSIPQNLPSNPADIAEPSRTLSDSVADMRPPTVQFNMKVKIDHALGDKLEKNTAQYLLNLGWENLRSALFKYHCTVAQSNGLENLEGYEYDYLENDIYQQPFIKNLQSEISEIKLMFTADGPENILRADNPPSFTDVTKHKIHLKKFMNHNMVQLKTEEMNILSSFQSGANVRKEEVEKSLGRCCNLARLRAFFMYIGEMCLAADEELVHNESIYQELFAHLGEVVGIKFRAGKQEQWKFKAFGETRTAKCCLFARSVTPKARKLPLYAFVEVKKPVVEVCQPANKKQCRSDDTGPDQIAGCERSAELYGQVVAAAGHDGLVCGAHKEMSKTVFFFLVTGTKVQIGHAALSKDYLDNFGFHESDMKLLKGSDKKTISNAHGLINISKPYEMLLSHDMHELLQAMRSLRAMADLWNACMEHGRV